MGNFYDDNPKLFMALNLLKSSSIVYQLYNPEEYRTLLEMRATANEILAYDGCKMDHNSDFNMIFIRFIANDEYTNHLRAKFTANDMRVYVALLQHYEEQFNANGPYIHVSVEELQMSMNELRLGIGSRQKMPVSALTPHLKKFSSCGILKKYKDKEYIINPGILTCVSRDQFDKIYEEVIKPWLAENEDTEQDAE